MGNKSSSVSEAGDPVVRSSSGRRSGKGRKSKSTAASMPDLDRTDGDGMRGRSASFDGLEDRKGEVKIYRSYSEAEEGRKSVLVPAEPNVDIKVYRRSTTTLGRSQSSQDPEDSFQRGVPRSMTLPRNLGANRPDFGRGARSTSTLQNQRYSSIEPGMPIFVRPTLTVLCRAGATTMTDAMLVKRKQLQFETDFVKHITDLHAHLSDFVQLSALSIAIGPLPQQQPLSLWEYLTNDSIPLDLTGGEIPLDGITRGGNSFTGKPNFGNSGDVTYRLTIPPAMFHGVMHLKRDEITGREQRLSLAQELFVCMAVEAAAELSAMFEYQIGLVSGNREINLLALHAAQCSVSYLKANNRFIDRNTIIRGVLNGRLPMAVEDQKIFSVVVGRMELKWILDEVFKLPGLMVCPQNISQEQEQWQFYTTEDSQPEKYGYRMVMWEKDFMTGTCQPSMEDMRSFTREVPSSNVDFHQLYRPKHKRVERGMEPGGVEVRGRSRSFDGLLEVVEEDVKRVERPVSREVPKTPRTPMTSPNGLLATIEEFDGLPDQNASNQPSGMNNSNINPMSLKGQAPCAASTPNTTHIQNTNGEYIDRNQQHVNGSRYIGQQSYQTNVPDTKRNSNAVMPDLLAYSTPGYDAGRSSFDPNQQDYYSNQPGSNNNISKNVADQNMINRDMNQQDFRRHQPNYDDTGSNVSVGNSPKVGMYSPTSEAARRLSGSSSPPTSPGSPNSRSGKIPPKVPIRRTPYSGSISSRQSVGDSETASPQPRVVSEPPLPNSDVGAIESVSSVYSSKSSLVSDASQQPQHHQHYQQQQQQQQRYSQEQHPRYNTEQQQQQQLGLQHQQRYSQQQQQQPKYTPDLQNFSQTRPASAIDDTRHRNPRNPPPAVPRKPSMAARAPQPTNPDNQDFMNFNDFLNVLRASQSAEILDNLSSDSRVQSMIIPSSVTSPTSQQSFGRTSSPQNPDRSTDSWRASPAESHPQVEMRGGFPDFQNFVSTLRVSQPVDPRDSSMGGDISPDGSSTKSRGSSSGSGGIMKPTNGRNSWRSSQHKVQFVPYDYAYDPATNQRTEIRASVGDDVFIENEQNNRRATTSTGTRGVLVADL